MAILHSERGASKGPPSPSTSRIPPAGFSNGRAAGSVAKSPHPIWGPALSRRLVRSPSASRRHEKLEFWEAPSSALGWPTPRPLAASPWRTREQKRGRGRRTPYGCEAVITRHYESAHPVSAGAAVNRRRRRRESGRARAPATQLVLVQYWPRCALPSTKSSRGEFAPSPWAASWPRACAFVRAIGSLVRTCALTSVRVADEEAFAHCAARSGPCEPRGHESGGP